MKFSQEFISKLHEVYPDDKELHQLAEEADPNLWGILHDKAQPLFRLCGMVSQEPIIRDAVEKQTLRLARRN